MPASINALPARPRFRAPQRRGRYAQRLAQQIQVRREARPMAAEQSSASGDVLPLRFRVHPLDARRGRRPGGRTPPRGRAGLPRLRGPARLIGVLEAEQTEDGKTIRNDRLIAVVETPYNPAEYRSLDEVSGQRLDEIEHFFVSYNQMEGRQVPTRRAGRGRDAAPNDDWRKRPGRGSNA